MSGSHYNHVGVGPGGWSPSRESAKTVEDRQAPLNVWACRHPNRHMDKGNGLIVPIICSTVHHVGWWLVAGWLIP